MSVKLQTEHQLEFLSLKGGCTGSSESTLVKMPHCWKSHVVAQIILIHVFHTLIYVSQHMRFWYLLHCRAMKEYTKTGQSMCCLHAQSMDVDEESDQNLSM